MKLYARRFAPLLIVTLFMFTPWAQAEEEESYGSTVGRKALNGFANIGTSFLEIPKNVINVNNKTNFAWGLVGGSLQGLLNLGGRTFIGLTDLILAPLPTQPVVYPMYVWQDFETDTSYDEIFRLCRPSDNPCRTTNLRHK